MKQSTFVRVGVFAAVAVAACGAWAGTRYVRPDGDDGADGLTWETALATPQAAVDALGVDGGEVYLGEGTFTGAQPLVNLTNDVRLVGRGMGRTFLAPDNTAIAPTVIQAHSNAVVSGVSVVGNSKARAYKVVGKAGRIEACCIGTNTAGGVLLSGSGVTCLVTRCVIAANSGVQNGGGLYSNASKEGDRVTIENTLFDGNQATGSEVNEGGGAAYLSYIHSRVNFRYCTFVNNYAPNGGAFGNSYVGDEKITLENCILAGNTCDPTQTSADFAPGGYGKPYKLVNTYARDAYAQSHPGTNPITGILGLTDFEGGDYRPRLSSCTRDAGVSRAGDEDKLDLDGGVRISGEGPDAGCYELQMADDAFLCDASCPVEEAAYGTDLTFTSTVVPAGDYTYQWSLLSADGTVVATGSGASWTPNLAAYGKLDVQLVVTSKADPTRSTRCTVKRIVNVRPATTYVRPADAEGVAPVYPYDSWKTATTNVYDAIDAVLTGGTVVLSNGTHGVTRQVELTRAVTLRGFGGRDNTILKHVGKANDRTLYVCNENARVEDLTMWGGNHDVCWTYGYCVRLESGTIADCRITGVTTKQAGGGGGIAVYGDKSRVTRTIIDNNTYPDSYSFYGGGVYIKAGLMDSCLIKGNRGLNGGGVCMTGKARLVNCTIIDNYSSGDSGGGVRIGELTSGVGCLQNCIIVDNRSPVTMAAKTGYPEWTAEKVTSASGLSVISNSVVTCSFGKDFAWPLGSTCVNEDPLFNDATAGDYSLNGQSKLINAGTDYDGVANDTDLAGNPRKSGKAVDVGAYEYDLSKRSVTFTVNPTLALAGDDVSLVGSVMGGDETTAYTYDWTATPVGETEAPTTGSGQSWVVNTLEPGRYDITLSVTESESGAAVGTKTVADALQVGAKTNYVVSAEGYAGDGGVWPYDTWEKATTNVFTALDTAVAGGTVFLGAGEFVVADTVAVTNAITLAGSGWAATTLRHDTSAGKARVLRVDHPNARVEGLTLTGGNLSKIWTDGYAVSIGTKGGTLSHCRIAGNTLPAGGVEATLCVDYDAATGDHALVENCVIDDNRNSRGLGAYYDTGGAVRLNCGTFRNNLVFNNDGCQYGGVGVYGPAFVQNNTIVSNRLLFARAEKAYSAGGGGVCFGTSNAKTRFENNLIGFNTAKKVVADFDMVGGSSAAVTNCVATTVKNCLFSDGTAFGVDAVVGSPIFKTRLAPVATQVDWRLRAFSPGLKAGLYDDSWMPDGVDLYDTKRTKRHSSDGPLVDIGAAESNSGFGGAMLIIQ